MTQKLNRYSSRITQPKSQGASQAMLYGAGLNEDDMGKAEVGIASVWYEGNTCNMHLNDLAARVKEGVVDAGLVGMRFNTIGVSDGISMGTDGMSYSLQSRDLIADSIETVMNAQWYDANISLPGCDKNMPGCLIAMDPTYYSVTSVTFIGQIYGMLGLESIADAADPDGYGFPQLTEEYIVDSNPDFIFLADAQCCGESSDTVGARPGWANMSAVLGDKVVEVDADIASRWGPRTVDFIESIAAVMTAEANA